MKEPIKWDDLGSRKPKAEYDCNNEMLLKFLTNKPTEIPSQFDERRLLRLFDTEQKGGEVILMTSSIRLVRALKQLGDLQNKTVRIKRFGQGTSTRFTAELVA